MALVLAYKVSTYCPLHIPLSCLPATMPAPTACQVSEVPITALLVSTVCWPGCRPGRVAPAGSQDAALSPSPIALPSPAGKPLAAMPAASCWSYLPILHLPSTSPAHSAAWCLGTPVKPEWRVNKSFSSPYNEGAVMPGKEPGFGPRRAPSPITHPLFNFLMGKIRIVPTKAPFKKSLPNPRSQRFLFLFF